jgi:small basic protein
MKSYLLSVLAILVCAVPSAFGAWMLWKSIGLSGVTLSVATALSAMVLATALFALLSALRNRLLAKQESRKGE